MSAWIFALWVLTAALAAPLLIGLCLGGRLARAQRRIVRTALATAPLILLGSLVLPDPFGGRPLLRLAGPDESAATAAPELAAPPAHASAAPAFATRRTEPTAPPAAEPGAPPRHGPSIGPADELPLEAPPLAERAIAAVPAGAADVAPNPSPAPAPASSPDPSPDPSPEPLPGPSPYPAPASPATRTAEAARPALELGGPLAPIRHPTAAPRAAAPHASEPWHPVRAPAPPPPSREPAFLESEGIARALLFIWLTGVLVALLRLAASARAIARLRHRATAIGSTRGVPLIDPSLPELAVRVIPGLRSAAAVGVLAPEVWLPAHWAARLDRASLQTLLGHEAAHHRESDPLWRIIGAVVVALFWPHPLVHRLRRSEESLSELLADRRVLAAGAGPRRYAALLATLASEAAGPRLALVSGVLGTRSPLERRIRMILSTPVGRAPRDSGWAAPALLGLLCAAVLGLSVCFPLVGDACDPEDDPPIEVVLLEEDGWWHLCAKEQGGECGAVRWLTRLAPVERGPAFLERDGVAANVRVGDEMRRFDVRTGRQLDAARIQLVSAPDELLGWIDVADGDRAAQDEEEVRLADSIARLRAEIEERCLDLERLHEELARREAQQEEHADALGHRLQAELGDIEEEVSRARNRLAVEEQGLAERPDDERARRRVELAERRAELARHADEMRARRQAELAELHEELAERRRELAEGAHEQMVERLAEIEALRQELLEEERALAQAQRAGGTRGTLRRDDRLMHHSDDELAAAAELGDRGANAESRDAHLLLERALRELGRTPEDLHEHAAELAEELHEHAGEVSEELKEALAEIQEAMAEMRAELEGLHGKFEDLPEMLGDLEGLRELESLRDLPEALGDLGSLREELRSDANDLRRALEIEREKNAKLEAENRELRKQLEAIKPKGGETIR